MAEPVRHRQTKGAATDMFDLQPPRHISTLRFSRVRVFAGEGLLAEPIAGPQLQWRELVFMPPQHPLAPTTVGGSPAQPLDRCPCRRQDLRRAATSFDGTEGTHFITADRWPVSSPLTRPRFLISVSP